MEKKIVNMSIWRVSKRERGYKLSGIADHHPKLGRNVYVAGTSTLKKYSFEEDVLTYETRNTIYKCPLKYMETELGFGEIMHYDENQVKKYEESDSMLDKIMAASVRILTGNESDSDFAKYILKLAEAGKAELEAAKKADDERLINIAKNYENCVYLEVSNIDCGDKLAYHLGDECGVVEPILHSGMFQDSVLYMEFGVLDFRYFPMAGFSMETYSWSDNIMQVVIKNVEEDTIYFNHEEVAPGETKVFTPQGHREGLFSPDCYNGKSVFSGAVWEIPEDDD
ncbi:MAG: hypothetical protein J1E62_05305 [Lachnospiraceae bacterium]|nr:hypothetical protein [Lachnospiraceae bacterium]